MNKITRKSNSKTERPLLAEGNEIKSTELILSEVLERGIVIDPRERTATEQDSVSSSTNIAHLAGTARTAGRQQKRWEAVLTSGTQKIKDCALIVKEKAEQKEQQMERPQAMSKGETDEDNWRNAENVVDFGSDEKVVRETLPLPEPSLSTSGEEQIAVELEGVSLIIPARL
ncbi:hypothetical protein BLNAU_20756 [Blattamonas nauphoetae]|uniref:Uncharacterized protein n=1 Tax=Blattamonas nauphoetae TaxID=2049346 RepID=A0ABQ9WXR9_9EUKA|nr:hypothetical protein BLNAU_20756 [Blattamonas nauphoetae]